jgi:hypothetical protein
MDIASSGEIYDTEFQMPEASRPTTDRTVYVRLFSFVDGHWQYVDYALTYRAAAQLVFPRDGDMDADVVALPLEWTEVEAAENYRLQLGTSPGENNVLDTGDVQRHTFRSAVLPGGVTIYARTWTEVGGEWRHSDASFTTRPAAALLHPHYGQLSVDTSQPIDWTSIPDAEAYRLELGSTPGAHDLLDSGSLAATSIDASAALASAPPVIYARIWTRYAETWEFSDAIFETVSNPDAASMDWISDKSAFVASDAFRWTEVPLAASYRLRVGTTRGSSDIHDSGSVRTARRLVADLPAGIPLYGSLDTEYFDGSVSTQEFEFTVADATIGFEARWKHAQWAAAKVRSMATWNNVPLQNTLLLDAARRTLREWTATCSTYTLALLDLLENSNITPYARRLDVCLNRNGFDCHTLVEVLDVDSGRWLILDPTFALVARRTIDNEWATALDIFAATRDKNFAAIEYVPLTSDGLALAEGYYLDYPLLYAHVLAPGTYSNPVASVDSTISYYDLLGTSSVAQSGNYAIVCTAGNNSAQIRVSGSGSVDDDDSVVTVPCDSDAEGLSHVFQTTSIEAAGDPASYEIAVPKRFVFN